MARFKDLSIGILALAALAGTIAGADQAGDGDLIQEAGYEFRYFGQDLGDESFRITRTAGGYRIEATLELGIKGQIPSEGVYELDEHRRLTRATYRELVPGGAHAEYVVENGVLIARGIGGSAEGEHRIALDPDTIVTGPHYVTDFFVLHPLGLDVGESREQVAYAFGFGGWEPTRVTLKSKRTADSSSTDMHSRLRLYPFLYQQQGESLASSGHSIPA